MLLQLLLPAVLLAQVDPNTSIQTVSRQVAQAAMTYYTANPDQGSVAPNAAQDASGVQWYESGVYWGAFNEYARIYQDTAFAGTVATALGLASNKQIGSFLGANKALSASFGKWVFLTNKNDDIMWYGLAALAGAEVYGNSSMSGGQGLSFLKIAQNTYNEVWEQWDVTQCGGGIYWSRDRTNAKSKGYKSSITNAQHIMMGARLYLLTGTQSYLDNAKLTYSWLKKGLVASGHVYDGVDGSLGCGQNVEESSYNSGMLAGALAWMFKATNDPSYIDDASVILKESIALFAPNGIITDKCEPNCAKNSVQSKGTFIRGLGYLAAFTTKPSDKAAITGAFETSYQAMLKTCDSKWNCGNAWTVGTKASNFHTQLAVFELVNAVGTGEYGISGKVLSAPSATPVEQPDIDDTASNAFRPALIVSAFVAILLLL